MCNSSFSSPLMQALWREIGDIPCHYSTVSLFPLSFPRREWVSSKASGKLFPFHLPYVCSWFFFSWKIYFTWQWINETLWSRIFDISSTHVQIKVYVYGNGSAYWIFFFVALHGDCWWCFVHLIGSLMDFTSAESKKHFWVMTSASDETPSLCNKFSTLFPN